MPRELLESVTGAIREALVVHRDARARRHCADTPPSDRWIEEGADAAALEVIELLGELGLEVIEQPAATVDETPTPPGAQP